VCGEARAVLRADAKAEFNQGSITNITNLHSWAHEKPHEEAEWCYFHKNCRNHTQIFLANATNKLNFIPSTKKRGRNALCFY
jgi:hypothetical protein